MVYSVCGSVSLSDTKKRMLLRSIDLSGCRLKCTVAFNFFAINMAVILAVA